MLAIDSHIVWADEAHRDMDSATSQLVDVLYGKGPTSSMTTEGMCKQTGLTRRQALPREIRLASAMLLAMQHEQREFEMSLKSSAEAGDLRLLLYIESAAMDETPMPVRSASNYDITSRRDSHSAMLATIDSQTTLGRRNMDAFIATKSKGTGVHKILHVETNVAYLVARKSESQQEEFILISRSCPTRLFIMDRCTGENLRQALRFSESRTMAAASFQQHARLSCCDKAASNQRAEYGFADGRRVHGFGHPQFPDCDVHIAATIHGATFAPMSKQVQGLVRVALSLSFGTYIDAFRKILPEVVMERAVIKVGTAPASAQLFRQRAMILFSGRGGRAVQRLLALRLLPNGDWRKPDVIEMYCDRSVRAAYSDDQLKNQLAFGLELACLNIAPPVYNRHRWLGMDLSLDALGRLSIIHDLLPVVYGRFVQRFGTRPLPAHEGEQRGPAEGERGVAIQDQVEDENLHAQVGGGQNAAVPGEPQPEQSSWQAEHSMHRKLGFEFTSDGPQKYLILMRLLVEPLRELLASKLEVAD